MRKYTQKKVKTGNSFTKQLTRSAKTAKGEMLRGKSGEDAGSGSAWKMRQKVRVLGRTLQQKTQKVKQSKVDKLLHNQL